MGGSMIYDTTMTVIRYQDGFRKDRSRIFFDIR